MQEKTLNNLIRVICKRGDNMNKMVTSGVNKENYHQAVDEYISQLQKEQDITLFEGVKGYYMLDGLVHELRLEGEQLLDVTYGSWSKEEKNFVLNVLDNRIW